MATGVPVENDLMLPLYTLVGCAIPGVGTGYSVTVVVLVNVLEAKVETLAAVFDVATSGVPEEVIDVVLVVVSSAVVVEMELLE